MSDGINIWNGMSAAEAREQGMKLPDNIPDCAMLTLELDPESMLSVQEDGHRLPSIKFSLRTRWSWVTVTGIVETSSGE